MNNFEFVNMVQGQYQLSDIFSNDLLGKSLSWLVEKVVIKFASLRKLQNKVYVIIVLEMIVQFDNVIVVQAIHDFDLVEYLLNHIGFAELLLLHFFDGIGKLGLFVSCLVHFSEGTFIRINKKKKLMFVLFFP